MKARRRTSSTTRTTPTRMATPCRTGMSISSAATRTTRDVYSFGNAPLLIQLASDAGDGVEATYEIVSGPTLGTLSGDGQSLTYQRTAAGDDSLTFVTHRGGATSLPTPITIHNDPPFAISVAPEIVRQKLTLQGYSAGALVDVPLVGLGGEGSGTVRFGVELTGLDPGAPLTLRNPVSGGEWSAVPTPGGSLLVDYTRASCYGPSFYSFQIAMGRRDHVLGLVLDSGLTFPVTKTAEVGWNAYDEHGVSTWTGLGFFNASVLTGATDWLGGSSHFVDLTTGEQMPAGSTLMMWGWEPLDVNLITKAVTIVVPYEEPATTTYTLHTKLD